jgi:hypothetical protein
MKMCTVTNTRLDIDYDKGVPAGELGRAKSSRLKQFVAFVVMLVILAAALALKYWLYLHAIWPRS